MNTSDRSQRGKWSRRGMTMPVHIGFLKLVAGMLMAVALPVGAYEVGVPLERLATDVSQSSDVSWYTNQLPAADQEDGIALEFTHYIPAALCSTPQTETYLAQVSFSGALSSDDVIGITKYQVRFNAIKRRFTLVLETQPMVEGLRVAAANKFTYRYPVLDLWRDVDLCQASSPKYINLRIFFNKYNTLLEASIPGAPLKQVFTSPVNIGVGRSMIDAIKARASTVQISVYRYGHYAATENEFIYPGEDGDNSGTPSNPAPPPVEAADPIASVSTFYWNYHWRADSGGMYPSSQFNLLTDLNLNYGAKSYPVKSPILDKGRRASAAMGVVIAY